MARSSATLFQSSILLRLVPLEAGVAWRDLLDGAEGTPSKLQLGSAAPCHNPSLQSVLSLVDLAIRSAAW